MRYFLIGLPGSGKSHWGKIWAEKVKTHYYDLDEIIENNEGFSIAEIFEVDGEEYFRNLESFYLQKLIDNYQSIILSTGGGTACFNQNIDLMNKTGISIFLNPSTEENSLRIWNSKSSNKRPMFSNCTSLSEVQDVLSQLKNKRLPYYKKAKLELASWDKNTLLKLETN